MFIEITLHLHLVIVPWITAGFFYVEYLMLLALKDACTEEVPVKDQ